MSSDAESAKPPASRERRVRSARARLTPPGPQSEPFDKEHVAKAKRERVKSAKAIREQHEGSGKMFPRPPSRSGKERFTSSYSTDFHGKFVPPADLRPTSPTRRNNPHPGKQFMVWRLPTREIGIPPHEEGLELPPAYLAADPNFDAIDELGRSIDQIKMPPPQPSSMEYGAYLRQQAAQRKAELGLITPEPHLRPRIKPVSNDVLQRTLKTDTAALDEWLQTASPEERHTILKMLKSAEEAQVKETIHGVMQPAAAKAVTDWLKDADHKERDVAVRLFSSLGSRSGFQRPRSQSLPGGRPTSRPSSRQPLPPPLKMKSSAYTGASGERLRTRRLSAPPEGAKPQNRWPAGLWHHLPVRDPPPQVYHRGALFGSASGGASHYTVHPEWPDYYGSSFNSDAVH